MLRKEGPENMSYSMNRVIALDMHDTKSGPSYPAVACETVNEDNMA